MLGKKTDGLILDVDGTLWDSTGIVARAWTQAVRDSGFPDFEVTADGLKRLFGKTMEVIAEEMLPWLAKEKRESIMERCCEYEHRALEEDECRICYPGVTDTIRQLSKRLPVFIVSNCQSGYIELFLEKTGLGEYVTDIECYGNTKCGKGENIRMVAERNHLQNPVYVGDTKGDLSAAKEAGVSFIYVSYGFGDVENAETEISCFSDLAGLAEGGENR